MASLIPQESLRLVGELLSEPVTATIHAADGQRFALATDDRNPIYFEESAAQAAGYRTLVVPPTLLAWGLMPPRPLEDLRKDGMYKGIGRRVRLNVNRLMAGGEQWYFLQPIFAEDALTAETRLLSLEEKTGRSGPFVLQTQETTFTNQNGEVVARQQTRAIAR